jgi:hypothetical protein
MNKKLLCILLGLSSFEAISTTLIEESALIKLQQECSVAIRKSEQKCMNAGDIDRCMSISSNGNIYYREKGKFHSNSFDLDSFTCKSLDNLLSKQAVEKAQADQARQKSDFGPKSVKIDGNLVVDQDGYKVPGGDSNIQNYIKLNPNDPLVMRYKAAPNRPGHSSD